MASQLHYRTCNLCEAMCGLEIEHDAGQVVAIRGDKDDPLSRGHICPKAVALQDLHTDADRLRLPVRRTEKGWQEISWDEALSETAMRLAGIQARHGRNAVAMYAGNPTVHNHGAMFTLLPLLQALGTRNRYSATSVDQLPQMLASLKLFGHQLLLPVPDIDRTDHFFVIGANPMASNGSLMTAPDMRGRLKALRQRGGKLVVIDPRRTETATVADSHHFIQPGRDAVLLLAMLNVIFEQKKNVTSAQISLVDNLDRLAQHVVAWTPERAAPLCGLDAETIRRISIEFADAKSAVAYCRVGTSTSQYSSIAAWLVYALNIVTGNLDREGGLMFPAPAADMVAFTARGGHRGGFNRYRSRVRELPEFGGEFPVTTLADEMLEPGEGQVKALLTHAGNPVLSCPDGNRLDTALSQLDFMVSIDFYINETTRHADIILPPTGHLEHAQFDPVFHGLAVHNTIKFSPALFKPAQGARHDWHIMLELTRRLHEAKGMPSWRAKASEAAMRAVGDTGLIDLLLRFGPYGQASAASSRLAGSLSKVPLVGGKLKEYLPSVDVKKEPLRQREKLSLKRVSNAPHGIDLGPLVPSLPERLFTKNRRIDLFPDIYLAGLNALNDLLPLKEDAFFLIGRRHVRSNNSWMHNSRRLVKGKTRCDAMLNPVDAERLAVSDGELVSVSSEAGTISLPVNITEDVMPGVVSIPHGWGHGRKGVRLAVAQRHAGVSVNDVIGTQAVEMITGMAVLNGVPVEICKA